MFNQKTIQKTRRFPSLSKIVFFAFLERSGTVPDDRIDFFFTFFRFFIRKWIQKGVPKKCCFWGCDCRKCSLSKISVVDMSYNYYGFGSNWLYTTFPNIFSFASNNSFSIFPFISHSLSSLSLFKR